MRVIKVILTFCIISTAYFGDYVVFKSKFSNSVLFRAISDSLVHASIGLISSVLFFCHEHNLRLQTCVYNVIICTILSSLIDVDHFIVAKSIYFKDLAGLKQRGILHCTTFWLLVTTILLIYSYIEKKFHIYTFTFMIIIAFISHHVRDANRRGFWLYPFGHSPALDKNVYVMILAAFPHLLAYVYQNLTGSYYKSVENYAIIVA